MHFHLAAEVAANELLVFAHLRSWRRSGASAFPVDHQILLPHHPNPHPGPPVAGVAQALALAASQWPIDVLALHSGLGFGFGFGFGFGLGPAPLSLRKYASAPRPPNVAMCA